LLHRPDLDEERLTLTLGVGDDLIGGLAGAFKEPVTLVFSLAPKALALGSGERDVILEAAFATAVVLENVLGISTKLGLEILGRRHHRGERP